MRTIRRAVAAVILILFLVFLVGHALSSHGQTDTNAQALSVDSILQPVAPEDMPDNAAFFYLSDFLNDNGSLGPPWPLLKDTNLVIYSLKGSAFLVDDAMLTNSSDLSNCLALLVQPADAFSSNLLNGTTSSTVAMDSAEDIDPNDYTNSTDGGGGSSNTYSPTVVTYPSNVLWLQVATNNLAGTDKFPVLLRNTTPDEPYDVLTSTNLSIPLSQWTVEQSVPGVEGTNCTPVALMMNGRSNLFVDARFGGSSDGSGLPDWWEALYFPGATNGVDPYAQDSSGDGWSILDDFNHGWVPGLWHTPPPPQNFAAYLDSTGTNVILTWQDGGGPVDHYEIDAGDDEFPTDIGRVDENTFTFTDNSDFDFTDDSLGAPYYRVVAHFTNGDSSATGWVLGGRLRSLLRDCRIFRGPGGQYYVAVADMPQNLARLHWFWDSVLPSGDIDVSNFVDGIALLPPELQTNINQGSVPWIQLVDSNGKYSDIISANQSANADDFVERLSTYFPVMASPHFADASVQMKENLRFLLRSAGILWPFGYSSGVTYSYPTGFNPTYPVATDVLTPEYYYARGSASPNYEYYGYHTFSPNLNYSFIEELRPVRENFLWRNFIYSPIDYSNGNFTTGISSGEDTSETELWRFDYNPKYQYTGSGTETPLPLAFDANSSGWLFAPGYYELWLYPEAEVFENLGIYSSGSDWVLNADAKNLYGLGLDTAYADTNFIGHGGIVPKSESYLFENFAMPDLQIVDYYFNSQTPFFNYTWYYGYTGSPPAMPGAPTFSTTNTSPLLTTGIGQPITVSGWAKMKIANGDTNKFGYLEQYFDAAYTIDANGLATTNSGGLLSPYGDFFPIMPGPAALVTMPDIDPPYTRGTSIVNVIKLQLDVNHDGEMDLSFGGPDNTSQAHPFEFWINKDNDGTGIGTDSDPMGKTNLMDYTHGQIRSERNLEDFARLWICGMPALPFGCNVVLSFANTQGSPAINIYYANETNGDISYLTDTNVANAQVNESFYGSKLGTVSTNQNYAVPLAGGFEGPLAYTNFLFEGAGIGSGELVLTVWQGTNILVQTSQWLDLHDVKDFYERMVITNNATGVPSTWASAIESNQVATASGLGDDTNMIVLVHGINVSFTDWNIEADTVFKRLYWSGFYGKFAAVKWPCEFFRLWTFLSLDTSVFNRSEMKAYAASTSLKTYLDQLHERFPGYGVHLFVHSQGNAVASEAIEQGGAFDTYILTEGAISAGAYDAAAPLDSGLTNQQAVTPTPEWQPMGYHGIYTNMTGRIVNFYNTNDPVTGIWVDDQGPGKPNGYALYVAWEMNHGIIPPSPWYEYDTSSSNSWYETFSGIGTYMVTYPQESRAYVSRSLTQPIGRNPPETAHGVIKSGIDLTAHYGFLDAFPDDHSAQWVRTIQMTLPYYQQLLLETKPSQ